MNAKRHTKAALKSGSVVWLVRRPRGTGIQYIPGVWFDYDGDMRISDGFNDIFVTRESARLLAKRINQALDAWRKAR